MTLRKILTALAVAGAALFAGSAAMAECNPRFEPGVYLSNDTSLPIYGLQLLTGCAGDQTTYQIRWGVYGGCPGGVCVTPFIPVADDASRLRFPVGGVEVFIERLGGNRIRTTYSSAVPTFNFRDVLSLQ